MLCDHDHAYFSRTPSHQLQVASVNTGGLNSKLKYNVLHQLVDKTDIVCLSESRTNYIAQDEFPDHVALVAQSKRNHKFGGIHGLCVLVRRNIAQHVKIWSHGSSECVLWLLIDKSVVGVELVLGAVYIPHEGSIHYEEDIFDHITEDIIHVCSVTMKPLILIGDFNARTGLLDDFAPVDKASTFNDYDHLNSVRDELESISILTDRFSTDPYCNKNGRKLINMCQSVGLNIINGRFGRDKRIGEMTCHTANGSSVIDYTIMTPSLLPQIMDFAVDPFDKCLSDTHSLISLTLRNQDVHNSRQVDSPPTTKRANLMGECTKYNIIKTKWDQTLANAYKEASEMQDITTAATRIASVDTATVTQEGIDSITQEVCQLLIAPALNTGISKELKPRQNSRKQMQGRKHPLRPWFDAECEKLRKEYMHTKHCLQKSTLQNKTDAEEALKRKFSEYKKLLHQKKMSFSKENSKKLRGLKTTDPKEFWQLLNKFDSVRTNSADQVSLHEFYTHFCKLSATDETCDPMQPAKSPTDPCLEGSINEEINELFSATEVEKVIRSLKNNKACGVDNVTNEFLKNTSPEILHVMTELFNMVLKSGQIPTDWCLGIIQPIYKNKGSTSDPDNYRGITLLSCLGKLFTACINSRLTTFLNASGTLGDEQAGFRQGYSTIDHVFVLHTLIELYLFSKKKVYCAFIDYKKAFDLIDRTSLWAKLISYNINGRVLTVIKNMYEKAKSCVRQGIQLSQMFSCNIGVRQGENLSPLLFAIYLNDFELFLSKRYAGMTFFSKKANELMSDDDVEYFVRLFTLLYADDTIVLAETASELQKALDAVHDYCLQWSLTVNTAKTKVVVFSRGKIRKLPHFTFGSKQIEIVDDYIYLGTMVNYNGSFKKTIAKQVNQAHRAMFALLTKSRRLMLPIDIQCELFDKIIVPILIYGSEVWGFSNLSDIEIFHRKYLRCLLRLRKSTAKCMTYGELGRQPLSCKIYSRMLNYWAKISEERGTKLTHLMYRIVLNLHRANEFHSPWLLKIKNLLDITGNSELWLYQDQFPRKASFLKDAQQRLVDMNAQTWHEEVNSNLKCTNYRIFKNDLKFETYLTGLSCSDAITLCKFRCGNHNLPISARRIGNKEADVHCGLCDLGEVGDEFHYLFICPSLSNSRDILLKPYYKRYPNTHKMAKLFSSGSQKQTKLLVKLIRAILALFR